MNNILTGKFLEITAQYSSFQYLAAKLLYHLAPAIEGLKPASLFNLSSFRAINRLWEEYSHSMEILYSPLIKVESPKLKVFELRDFGCSKLLLFYNHIYLEKVISDCCHREFLEQHGYSRKMTLDEVLDYLKGRFRQGCPHELGLLLGFPLEDVKGYIENQGKNYLLNGYWKVYQEPLQAIATFNSYNRAKVKMLNIIARPNHFSHWHH